jgi:HAD superfamily hydrolase (TIGR01549 family)
MPSQVSYIFFDVGNTLLFPDRKKILAPLHQRNLDPTIEQWHAVERETKRKFDELMQHGNPVDHGFWFLFYSRLLEVLGLEDDSIRDALVAATRISANWGEMRPGTIEALTRIGEKHRLAVISNADGKIASLLEKWQLSGCFEAITDSGIVGHEKPHPGIFEAALGSMKAEAGRSLYVGDVYAVDYLGAKRAGMEAILFDVAGAYQDWDLPRVESLEELEERL